MPSCLDHSISITGIGISIGLLVLLVSIGLLVLLVSVYTLEWEPIGRSLSSKEKIDR